MSSQQSLPHHLINRNRPADIAVYGIGGERLFVVEVLDVLADSDMGYAGLVAELFD